jgi:pimeloyl-[acyl-carrier protein] methyl ester esterase
MAHPEPSVADLIAMHGWAGDSAAWAPWQAMAAGRGWTMRCGERGYGGAPAREPAWRSAGRRLLLTHSMGPHLLPPALLANADAVVLLAGFGRFVPEGAAGRGVRQALAAMQERLSDPADPQDAAGEAEAALRAQALLQEFLRRAAAPEAAEGLPAGPADRPVSAPARSLLRQDLGVLAASSGLPEGFPGGVPVLIVEAGADAILAPEARRQLRLDLPDADRLLLPSAGHCLLDGSLLPQVFAWIDRLLEVR